MAFRGVLSLPKGEAVPHRVRRSLNSGSDDRKGRAFPQGERQSRASPEP
jgi:hypothetical protein